MKITVEVDEKFKLAATSFQFGNLMKFTIPVFHYLGQYIQGFYESANVISLLALLSCTVSILLHHLKLNAKGCHERVFHTQL